VSELIAAPADPQDVVEDPEHVIEAVRQPPVVITEQEVALSTAAAVPLPRTKPAPMGSLTFIPNGERAYARMTEICPRTPHRLSR
jgi:hypothetical protein